MAQEVLTHLKEHPDAWTRVDTILEFSQNMNTKVSQPASQPAQVDEGHFSTLRKSLPILIYNQ